MTIKTRIKRLEVLVPKQPDRTGPINMRDLARRLAFAMHRRMIQKGGERNKWSDA
jgi:hypothetical protein